MKAPILAVLATALVFVAAVAEDAPKASNLKDGLEAAKKSGRLLLVVTSWKRGVCNSCDTWHDRVPRDPDVVRELARFEQAEWLYDGLGGKVIAWTRENGGTSEDPSVQAFVVAPDGGKVARAPRDTAYAPGEFAQWLKGEADAWDKAHPPTRLPFAAAEVATEGEGAEARTVCAAVDAARAAGRPVLVYVGRGERPDADKAAKAQAALSRKLEKGALDSEAAAKAADGWLLVKLDLADAAHAAYAKSLGAEKAPVLLLLVPGEEKPQTLDAQVTGDALAFRLRKFAAKR